MEINQVALIVGAALAAGIVNSVAGGGSLLLYPAMLGAGLAPVPANVTNSLCTGPGFVASMLGSRADLSGQRHRVRGFVPTAILGSSAGCALLLLTPAAAFEAIVPYLVIGAALLFAFQSRVRSLVGHPRDLPTWLVYVMVGVASVYVGYFGAAGGVIIIAILSLTVDESITRISALKNVISAVGGLTTVVAFALFGPVNWFVVLLAMPLTVLGGYLGAKLVRVLPVKVLRFVIVAYGLGVGVYLAIWG